MIFEADWQLLLKWHSSQGFLPKSEEARALTLAQGGNRKGRSTIDQATQQVIETESIKLQQQLVIDLFLDLRHCFDLMIEACHNMACQRHGAADDYLWLHAKTHRLFKYYVRHKYSISKEHNTFEQSPWYGAEQGAADAALQYIVLSNTLIDAFHKRFCPWAVPEPTATIEVLKSLKAFIDDVAMSVYTDSSSFDSLVQCTQEQVQWWNGLIRATGGALNPNKCCCMVYTWAPDKFGILRPNPPPPAATTIAVVDQPNSPLIPVLSPTERTQYLGIYLNQLGTATPMEGHLWKKALWYTTALQHTPMTRREAGVLYCSCFLPALTYPLPATSLSPQFLDCIHRLSTSSILNKMGFHRNLLRSLVFAPHSLDGIGLSHLDHDQSAQKQSY